jgi:hypothetical protein
MKTAIDAAFMEPGQGPFHPTTTFDALDVRSMLALKQLLLPWLQSSSPSVHVVLVLSPNLVERVRLEPCG